MELQTRYITVRRDQLAREYAILHARKHGLSVSRYGKVSIKPRKAGAAYDWRKSRAKRIAEMQAATIDWEI